jgi:hypothetical protein
MAVADRFAFPGMATDIEANWAVKRTDPALNTARGLWHYLPGYERLAARGLLPEKFFEHG